MVSDIVSLGETYLAAGCSFPRITTDLYRHFTEGAQPGREPAQEIGGWLEESVGLILRSRLLQIDVMRHSCIAVDGERRPLRG